MAIVHPLLQPLQDDPYIAQAPLPVGIDAAVLAGQAYGQPLQAAVQYSVRHYQQQPINASRIVLATAIQLEDPRFLNADGPRCHLHRRARLCRARKLVGCRSPSFEHHTSPQTPVMLARSQ